MIGSIRFQKESLILTKNKTTGGTWSLRYYEEVQGERVYRKRRIGTERESLPAVTPNGLSWLFAPTSTQKFVRRKRWRNS